MARQSGAHCPIGIGKPCTPLLRAGKLRGNGALWRSNWWRTHHQNRRNGHSRLDRRLPYLVHQRSDPLSCRPGSVVRVRKLKIIRTQHQDDQRQRRMYLDALRQTEAAIAARFERIFPNGAPAVQTILDHSHPPASSVKPGLEHTRPAFLERQSVARIGNNPPRQRIGIHKNLPHRRIVAASDAHSATQ